MLIDLAESNCSRLLLVVERAKFILSHLELHSVKPEAKTQGPKAKNTVQDEFPKSATPQMDLFGDF